MTGREVGAGAGLKADLGVGLEVAAAEAMRATLQQQMGVKREAPMLTLKVGTCSCKWLSRTIVLLISTDIMATFLKSC